MTTVWVIGSLNVDRGWRVERHAQVGETVFGEMLASGPGGKGLNQAVAARRAGVDVALIGRVGDDADGRWLTELAIGEGIDVSWLGSTSSRPTGSALIVIAADGANTVTVDPGANATLVVDPALVVDPGDVVVGQLEVPADAVRTAFAVARAAGATSVLNPSPLGTDRSLVAAADLVVVNQAEAAELAGASRVALCAEDAIGQARAILFGLSGGASRVPTVVVTLGADGVVAVGPEGPMVVPGVAAQVVDTTGAGDCFLGVVAAGLAEGRPLHQTLDRATAAAALAVGRLGTVAAMPFAAELA